MNMEFKRKLPMPQEIKEMLPLSPAVAKTVKEKTALLKEIFEGKRDLTVLIIGPCSADREDSVLDYVSRLVPIQEQVRDKLMIIPRIYTPHDRRRL